MQEEEAGYFLSSSSLASPSPMCDAYASKIHMACKASVLHALENCLFLQSGGHE